MTAGPLGDLATALRHLHRRAGEPTTREVGGKIGYSHTTVAQALSGTRCPRWTVVESIVVCLGGEPEEFRNLWKAVRDDQDPLPAGASSCVLDSAASGDEAEGDAAAQGPAAGEPSPIVMRVQRKDEMIEFLHVGLALQWIKANTAPGCSNE